MFDWKAHCQLWRTNLRITKRPMPFFCHKVAQGWSCGYAIRVWSTGPGVYNDKIEVRETLPFEPVQASWNGLWNCEGQAAIGNPDQAICTHPVVELQPGQSRLLHLKLVYSDAQIKQLGCKVPNRVEIIHAPGGSFQNTNPADDKASATAQVLPSFCAPAVPSNLKLVKGLYASPDYPLTDNATWCRKFRIVVWNTGPGIFNGPIKVHDLVPPGTTASFEELGAWTCNAATKVCETNGSVVMKPNEIGDGRIFNVHVSGNDSVAHALNCRLNNTARIIAPVGPPWNILPADDQSHAAYDLPAELCHQPANLKLTKMSAQVGCNTTGGNQWRCVYNVLVRNMGPGSAQRSHHGAGLGACASGWRDDDVRGALELRRRALAESARSGPIWPREKSAV